MKIFVLFEGSRWEGGEVISLHTNESSGRAAASKLIEQYSRELVEMREAARKEGDYYWDASDHEMKEVRTNYWQNRGHFISLTEMETVD